jgi:D-serine deaminase-like pyridoxal phosphate-dependent protein
MRLDDIPTPALLVDLDLFDKNVRLMAEQCRHHHCALRPHVKAHKCPEIAKKQIAAGAIGVSAATLTEADAMVQSGIAGVLLTSPVVEPAKITHLVKLVKRAPDLLVTVGHPMQVERLAAAAEAAEQAVKVLIDLDVGDKRTGILPELAEGFAKYITEFAFLRLQGLQAYAGHASHIVGWKARTAATRAAIDQAVKVRSELEQVGLPTTILTCGSTGAYNIDSAVNGVTEIQPGSYIFMDLEYRSIGGQNRPEIFDDFAMSLTVLTTVVSATYKNAVTVDAGIKALATDVPIAPVVKDRPDLSYRRAGDEFGIVTVDASGKRPSLGDRLQLYPPHSDPTVNLYDRMYGIRGGEVERVWPVLRGFG